MEATTYQEVQGLSRMTVGELRDKYLEVFGEETLSHPLIYASPNTAVNVRRPSSISPKRCTSGRSRSSGIIGISS